MKRIASIIPDKRLRLSFSLALISLCIWFAGPYIAVAGNALLASSTSRLLIILILALYWGFNNLRFHKTVKTSSTNLPVAITVPSESLTSLTTAKLLQQNFKDALQIIKTTLAIKFWQPRPKLLGYLLVGSAQAGKTSLLASINPETASKPLIKHQYCDWWLINNKLFLDFNFPHDASAHPIWLQFIETLRRFRKRQALNGLILTINLQQLWSQSRQQQQAEIEKTVSCVRELSLYYPKLPVYLVFTQSDLIAGFNEFFADMDAEERMQALGVIFPRTRTLHSPIQVFEAQFNNLLKRLNERLIWRMHHERNPQKRAYIKDFPAQLEMLKPMLAEIITPISDITASKLQGCYFVSSLQQGIPIDYLTKPLATAFALSLEETPNTNKPPQNKNFFMQELFTRIIANPDNFIDANIPTKNVHYSVYLAAALIITTCSLLWYRSYAENVAAINSVKTTIANAKHPDLENMQYPYLATLNALAASLHTINQDRPAQLGLHQTKHLKTTANAAYQQMLLNQLVPDLTHILTNKIQTLHAQNPSELYGALKVYLMLSDPSKRDPQFIAQWFGNYWQQTLPDNVNKQKQLAVHLAAALHETALKVIINPQTVSSARNILNQIPLAQLSYSVLLDDYNQKPLKLYDDKEEALILKDPYTIPALYSAANFNKVYNQEIFEACQEVLSGNWILGQKSISSNSAPASIVAQVQNLYLNQYANAWSGLLDKISINNFSNLDQAAQTVKSLSDKNSPLFQLLNAINTNTMPNANAAFNKLVSDKFSALNNFTQSAANSTLKNALVDLRTYLEKITHASDRNKAAFTATAARMEMDNPKDPLENLFQQAPNLPAPLQTWINTIATNTWQLMLSDSQAYLNKIWSAEVLPEYNAQLANHYPLFKTANTDATLTGFAKFFMPHGTINTFFNEYIKSFVDTSNFYWVWKKVDNQTINIPQSTLEAFIRASLIEKMFFSNNNDKPVVKFSLAPIELEPGVNKFSLKMDGQNITYQLGQPQINYLVWPGPNPGTVAMQFINDAGKQVALTEEGPWAWFKLLAKTNLQATPNPKRFKIIFDLNGNAAKYELLANDLVNPFIPGIIDAFRCPDKL